MLKIQEVVNFVNNKLNELGTESGYSFDIHAEVGENQNNGKINGILYTNQASSVPVPNYIENEYGFVCELIVPSARANYHFEQIQSIVESFVDTYDGTQIDFENGYGVINVTPSKPENFNVGYNAGENVPLFFTIAMLYTETSVTSADVHWLLDGIEIPYINEDIIVDKEGNINKIYGKKASQTFLTGQTKYFRFRFPYKVGTLCNTIQSDLLEGNFDKQYTLTYYDGQNYILDSETKPPFTTKVSIYKSGNTNGQRGKTKIFDVTFAEVDDGSEETTYKLALIDNKFDNQAEDTRWFGDETITSGGQTTTITAQEKQQAYFESKVNQTSPILTGTRYEQIKAPNLNSLDITSQIYPNNAGYDLFDLANKNYAIIKVEKGQPTLPNGDPNLTYEKKYFYYFVTNCQIGQNNQVLYDLRLDTIQTYYFDPNIEFSDCYIERSCLNRWVAVTGDNTKVAFDGGVDSKLFEREQSSATSKRLKKRTRLGFYDKILPTKPAIATWLTNNMEAWNYVFLDGTQTFTTYPSNRLTNGVKLRICNKNSTIFSTHMYCIAIPILKINRLIEFRTSINDASTTYARFGQVYNLSRIDSFLSFNHDDAYVLAKKMSNVYVDGMLGESVAWDGTITPVADAKIETNNGVETLVIQSTDMYSNMMFTQNNEDPSSAIEIVSMQRNEMISNEYELDADFIFSKSEITTATKNSKYNPKLLSSDFKSLKVTNQTEEGFEYDIQKINKEKIQISVSEPLCPDITKEYIRIKDLSGVYIKDTEENFTGTVTSSDDTLILMTSQYQSMLANNKNFFLQNSINRWTGLGEGLVGATAGIGLDMLRANPISAFGGIMSIAKNSASFIKSKIDENLTVDNLKNAPASIQNAKGNIFLNVMSTNMGVYVEEYDILPKEKEVANDYMVQNGFTTNQIGKLKDYIGDTTAGHKNARKYFNYIQAQISAISGTPMSNVARADMRQRFANGIRFWKQDNIDYTYENYELWLAE